MDKRYKVDRTSLLFIYFLMVPFIIQIGYYVYLLVTKPESYAAYKTLFALVVLYIVIKYLKMPHAVTVKEGGTLLFETLFSKKEIPIKNLIAVKTNITRLTIFFKYKNGGITMVNRIENLRELIATVRKKNKSVNIKELR